MLHIINIKVRKRGNRNDLSLRKNLFPVGNDFFQFGLVARVDLVDQQNDTFVGVLLQNLPLDQLAAATLDAIEDTHRPSDRARPEQ